MKRVLLGVAACAMVAFGIHAQVTPQAGSGESRLPKGIRGLSESQAKPPSANWLLDAKDDQERFRRLQVYAGGTDQQMWQIGYRYQQVYQAIIDQNWELGRHHWTKLRDVMNVALMKRPNRTPNAEAMFLDDQWEKLEEALEGEGRRQGPRCLFARALDMHGLSRCREDAVPERHAHLSRYG